MKNGVKKLNILKTIFSAIVIIGSIFIFILLILILCSFFSNNQDEIISIFISIGVAIVIVEYTFLRNSLLVYKRNLDDLIEEIKYIRKKADDQYFLSLLWIKEDFLCNSDSHDHSWLPKSTSYGLSYGLYQKPSDAISHGITGYVLQFFPSKAYYKFMERGLYEEIREKTGWFKKRELSEGRLSALMHIYDYTIEFSQKSQEIEILAHKLEKDEKYELNVNLLYSTILCQYMDFKQYFDKYLINFDPDNRKGLDLTFFDLFFDYLFHFVDKHFY